MNFCSSLRTVGSDLKRDTFIPDDIVEVEESLDAEGDDWKLDSLFSSLMLIHNGLKIGKYCYTKTINFNDD